MQNIRKMIALLLVVCTLGAIALLVHAETPDYTKLGSISITIQKNGKAIPGGKLRLYHVAKLTDHNGTPEFSYVSTFAECGQELGDLSAANLAGKLATYARDKQIYGIAANISAQGKCEITDLELGIYLVVQETPATGYEPFKPFLVTVPMTQEDGTLVYDVDASPKVGTISTEPTTKPTTKPTSGGGTPTTKPTGGTLPQTGQLWWPVPVLAIAGVLFLIFGWVKRRNTENT